MPRARSEGGRAMTCPEIPMLNFDLLDVDAALGRKEAA